MKGLSGAVDDNERKSEIMKTAEMHFPHIGRRLRHDESYKYGKNS
jgi:hypothetical protein